MARMKTIATFAVLISFIGVSVGCQSPSTVEGAQQRDRATGTGIGAAIGGIGVKIFGGNDTETAIGAGAGALIGYWVGDKVADERGSYAQALENIDKQIAETETQIASLQKEGDTIASKTQQRQQSLNRLKAAQSQNQGDLQGLAQVKQGIQENLDQVNEEIQKCKVQIAEKEEQVDSLAAATAEYPDDKELASRHETLKTQQAVLETTLKKLYSVKDDVVAQQSEANGLGRS